MRDSRDEPGIYLDNNATTLILPEVMAGMLAAWEQGPGNPSSAHAAGERARRELELARAQTGELLGASPECIAFTSGGTEANHLILRGLLPGGSFKNFRLITTKAEHSSILRAAEDLEARGREVYFLGVDASGRVRIPELEKSIQPGRTLVSVQWANNETGVVNPMAAIAAACRSLGALLHTDAIQAVGKLPLDVSEVPVDFLSFSAHKFHGPQGIGGLYLRKPSLLRPTLRGGDQEGGRRPGTENVIGAIGCGLAASIRKKRLSQAAAHMARLRDRFERLLEGAQILEGVNGREVERLPNTSNVRFAGVDGEALMLRLDAEGVRCSQGSACNNRKPEPSHVLRAMGLSEEAAYRSVRFSFSELNTPEEIDAAARKIVQLHKALSPYYIAKGA